MIVENKLLSNNLINKTINQETNSIIENKEKSFLICNNELKPLDDYWDGNNLYLDISLKDITKSCNKTRAFLGHTHILNTHTPSLDDFESVKKVKGIDGLCTIGLDGVGCYNKDTRNKIFFHKFNNTDLEKISKSGININEGKDLYCDGKEKYSCDIINNANKPIKIGTFNTVSSIGGINWLHPHDADFSIKTNNINEKLRCFSNKENLFCEVIASDDENSIE